jgi:hypothetical protein
MNERLLLFSKVHEYSSLKLQKVLPKKVVILRWKSEEEWGQKIATIDIAIWI